MSDKTYLDWPFFAEAHRKVAQEIAAWAAKNKDLLEHHPEDEFDYSRKLVTHLASDNWFRYSIPAAYGGANEKFDVRTICLLREALAYYSGLADFAFAMQGLGSGPLTIFGSEELKKRYLPGVGKGKLIPAFALSEADAGSDPAALALKATEDGSDYLLNGEKTWISNAAIADFYIIFARTAQGNGSKGLSAFLVDADTTGLEVIEKIPIIAPHPVGTLRLSDVRVPKSRLLGEPGQGFKIAMATLDVFRSTVGGAALGFARRALDEAAQHASSRNLFGQKLADFQMTEAKIAEMATEIDASALLVYRAAWLKDSGADRITREASMAKMYSTEAAQRIIDHAVQLFGGKGVQSGNVVEKLYREIRPLRIYEGATEIQKVVIAKQVLAHYRD